MATKPPPPHTAGTLRSSAERATAKQLDAFPDRIDLRDWYYQPALISLPDAYLSCTLIPRSRILDQGREGACTGFALAAVVNFLRTRQGRRRGSARACSTSWRGATTSGRARPTKVRRRAARSRPGSSTASAAKPRGSHPARHPAHDRRGDRRGDAGAGGAYYRIRPATYATCTPRSTRPASSTPR